MARGARFSIGVRTSDTTTAHDCLEIIAGAKRGFRLFELEIVINAATASAFGLGRPAAIGITPTTPVRFQSDSSRKDDLSEAKTALAWGTQPTIPAIFLRRVSLPATVGASIKWVFLKGIWVPAADSLVVWNLSTVSAADINATIEEENP
jgi:hypothetical protein